VPGVRLAALVCALFAPCLTLPLPAIAEGTTRIQQSDGTIHVYRDVRIRLTGQTLWIHSADHKGVLEVTTGACSFVRDVQRCLPFAATLRQHGKTHEIALDHGTVFLNLTDAMQYLPRSSEGIGPRQILVLLHTMHGTYVTVRGTLDEVKS